MSYAGVRRGHGTSSQAGPLRLLAPLPSYAQEKLPPTTHDLPKRVSSLPVSYVCPHSTTPLSIRIRFPDMVAILNFMYHGEVNVNQEDLQMFLAAAEELRIKGLSQVN